MQNIVKQNGINYKVLTCFLCFYYYCFSKIILGNFGNVKLSSAERSALGRDACYKIKCCSIICRLNKINSVSFVYYSLLVACFHGIHFIENIHLCEDVEPYLQ